MEAKPDGFHYSEHRTVDSKHNIAVNVRITPANVNDAEPAAEILKDIEKRRDSILSTWAGRGIPQRAGVPPACVSRDTAGSRLPEAYAQGGTISGNTVSPMIQSKTSIYVRKGMG